MTLKGHIENGAVVLDEPAALLNGTPVEIVVAVDRVEPSEASAPTLAKRLENFLKHSVDLPEDAATNVDHYLYGHPKT